MILRFLVIILFGWIPVKETFIGRMTDYIPRRLSSKGVSCRNLKDHQLLLRLTNEAYIRSKNYRGKVSWGAFLKQLDKVAFEVEQFLRIGTCSEKRMKEVLQFYLK